jgi:hypothetical protein
MKKQKLQPFTRLAMLTILALLIALLLLSESKSASADEWLAAKKQSIIGCGIKDSRSVKHSDSSGADPLNNNERNSCFHQSGEGTICETNGSRRRRLSLCSKQDAGNENYF